MKPVWLVAQREFAENAKTKGFWIGVLMFPFLIVVSLTFTKVLEKATPTRQFVLVDQSGEYGDVLARGVARLHARDVMQAFQSWVQENLAAGGAEVDLEKVPGNMGDVAREFIEANDDKIEEFLDAQGLQDAIQQVRPLLKPDAPEFQEPKRRFRQVALPGDLEAQASLDDLAEGLRPYLKGDKKISVDGKPENLFAAVLIPKDVDQHVLRPVDDPMGTAALAANQRDGIQYWAANLADNALKDQVERVVNDEIRRREYLARGVDADAVRAVQATHVQVASLNPKKAVGAEEVSAADVIRQWAPVGFVYLLWISIFTISQMLLNNTVEEKSNRIIEVLLSSVTARELMLGKLFGIAAVGLTMVASWIASLVGVLAVKAGPETEWAMRLFEVLKTSGLLPAFAGYFLFGYLMYAGIFLAIGSVCNTLKEAQNLMGPVMMIMIVPLFTMTFIPKDPNGTLATILSWIPIYTPFVMMNRAAASPPLLDIVGTGVLLLLFTLFVMWLTGRIFRIGILRTGQPPKLLEMLRWVRS